MYALTKDPDFYNFESDDNYKKWKKTFLASLEQIQQKVHSGLTAKQDALLYVEGLILRLLSQLINNQRITVADVEERVKRLFPYPLDRWATNKANETLAILKNIKKHKSLTPDQMPICMPVERLNQLLQKEVFNHKVDIQCTQYIVVILEYIAADIFQLAGHYVKNIRHDVITCQDIKVAMCADKVLMDMFYPDDDVSLNSNVNEDLCEQKRRTSVTYDEVVKDLIHEEKQFIRDLNLIIKVFRDPFRKLLAPKELDKLFFNIDDIYDFSVNFLGSIEDALEVAEDSCPPSIGSCFEELAECAEFDVYERYILDVNQSSTTGGNGRGNDKLQSLLADPSTVMSLSTTGHGMLPAFRYVLPKLLIGPVYHCFSYFKYIELFKDLTTSDEDKESFEQAEGLLAPLKNNLERVCKRNAKPGEGYLRLYGRTNRAQALTKMSELQRSIDGWEGKDIGQFCNEFVMDGPLGKLSGTGTRSGRLTERHVFLFDGLMVLCKPNNKRSSMTVAVTGKLFKDLTTSDEDKESFEQAEGLLAPLKNNLERVCKRNAKPD
ncbi:unnamed protein product [Oppiella nova]|uniref:DH domain-containing protein n=1 Tax=Oppiella nova TaxID=334625 RepID=A0A7R9LLV0_9ACAR|nr:unnamed protein product [Oppiella nova]CAG2164931.1 unnamed protein product [Oppiella nova]